MPQILTRRRTLLVRAIAAAGGASLLLLATPAVAPAASGGGSSGGTSDFRGVNWADPRDNYASDAVVPSGLALTDDYRTVYRTTQRMVKGFRKNLGANT